MKDFVRKYWKEIGLVLIGLWLGFKATKKIKTSNDYSEMLQGEFDKKNIQQLNELHPLSKDKFVNFLSEIQKLGFVVVITDAYRPISESVRLKKLNPKNATPGFSSHNYGMALDIDVKLPNGNFFGKTNLQKWKDSGILPIAKKYGFRWGGDFKDYADGVHFDDGIKYPSSKMYELGLKQFGTIEKIIGNKVIYA